MTHMYSYLPAPSLTSARGLSTMAALQDGHVLEVASNPFPCIHWAMVEMGWKIMGPSSRIAIFHKNRKKNEVIKILCILHVRVYAQQYRLL